MTLFILNCINRFFYAVIFLLVKKNKNFNLLNNNDFVFGASYDGGYYLVGMKEANDIIFKSESGNLKDIINIVESNNLKYGLTNKKHDIDDYEDLIDLSKRININDNKLKNTKIFLKEIEVI